MKPPRKHHASFRDPATGDSFTIFVPTINEDLSNFQVLFELWNLVNKENLNVKFDFSKCHMLRHNAVAFLGGLATFILKNNGSINFDWKTLRPPVAEYLTQNGFIKQFRAFSFLFADPTNTGNIIPYRHDSEKSKESLIDYLSGKWLGRGWVRVSDALRDAVVGTVWEIYENAFEHGRSPIGVFTCGQYYQGSKELKIAILDFGVGIPQNVKTFLKEEQMRSNEALKWAFQRGKSTSIKSNQGPRGLGLDLLKQFIKLNKGELALFSQDSYFKLSSDHEVFSIWKGYFQGTFVNISLKCDESYYRFKSDPPEQTLPEQPLF